MIATKSALTFQLKVVQSPGMPPSKIKDEPYTWAEISEIVSTNHLEKFARSAAQTDSYHRFKAALKEASTTVFKFLLVNQLKWYDPKQNGGLPVEQIGQLRDEEVTVHAASDQLFGDASDVMVLPNHFPYYFPSNVRHLCVWLKTRIPNDPHSPYGDISPATRQEIEAYVTRTFVDGLGIPRENICWFRNWEALQSVKLISHIHVIVKDMSDAQQDEVLHGPGAVTAS